MKTFDATRIYGGNASVRQWLGPVVAENAAVAVVAAYEQYEQPYTAQIVVSERKSEQTA